MTKSLRQSCVPWHACVILAALACDNAPPVIVAATVISDTRIESGPYEVRAVAIDDDGMGESLLSYTVVRPGGGPVDEQYTVPLVATLQERGTRLLADIPGQPLGSRVLWTLEVCDVHQRCSDYPSKPPAREFVVGLLPSIAQLVALAPDMGPQSGGTRVDLRGDDLRPGLQVLFGDVPSPHVEWLRKDLVVAVTPAHAPGLVEVSVTNPDGPSATLPQAFTFVPSPIIDSVLPARGPEAGGTAVVLAGRNFLPNDRAFFDDVACRHVALDVFELGAARITCDTPPGRGVVDVEVRRAPYDRRGGFSALARGFEYVAAPSLDVVTPDEGNSDGGDLVVIDGAGFSDGAIVLVGGAVCLDVVVESDVRISCTTPVGAPGVADVVVINVDGQFGTLPGGFLLLGPPVIVEVIPREVPVAGGVEVRVLGAGLHDSDLVTIAGLPALVVADVSSSELVVLVPAQLAPAPASGLLAVDIVVTRSLPTDIRSGALAEGLSYFWPPEVREVLPPRGPSAGGNDIVIVGRFLRAIAGEAFLLQLDGVDCLAPAIVSSTSIACTTAGGVPGPVDVSVQNHPLSLGSAADAYVYVGPPRVDSITPAEGPTFGGEVVVIRGEFFEEGARAFIDGALCGGVDVVSPQEIRCISPPGAEGPADVSVKNVDNQEGTAIGLYSYLGVAVSPDHGLLAGFTRVRVRGAGIDTNAIVTFGGRLAACTFVSSGEVTCQSPPSLIGEGPVDVAFVNPNGTGDVGRAAFDYRVLVARPPLDNIGVDPESGAARRNNANHVEVLDLDGDGDLDIVVAQGRVSSTEPALVLENAGGSFQRRDLDVRATGNTVSSGDVDGDGRPDLLFSASNGVGAVLLHNDGSLAFSEIPLPLPPQASAFDAALLDLVGDERLDVFVLRIGCDPFLDDDQPECDNSVSGPEVLLQQTDIGFADRSELVPHEGGWNHDHKLIGLDLELDGDVDLVVVTNNETFFTEEHRILRNRIDEGGGFTTEVPAALNDIIGDIYGIDKGDIDGDGDDDVVTSNCGDGVPFDEAVLVNVSGALARDDNALPSGVGEACVVGTLLIDIDGDADLDVLFGGTRSLNDTRIDARIYVNDGSGSFFDASNALSLGDVNLQINNFAGGDLDGDGDTDIVIAGGAPYRNTGRPGAVLVLELQ